MDNQHRQINGYRELSQVEIDLMNKIKAKGMELGELVAEVRDHLNAQDLRCATELARHQAAGPYNWWLEGKLDLQKGLMALTRAVAQPTTF